MSQLVGDTLPAALKFDLEAGAQTSEVARAPLLISVDEVGAPRVAVLSPGEVRWVDGRTLQLRVGSQSHTARNLRSTRSATLWCVLDAAAYSLRGTAASEGAPPEDCAYEQFRFGVHEVLRDFNPRGPLVSGPTYRIV